MDPQESLLIDKGVYNGLCFQFRFWNVCKRPGSVCTECAVEGMICRLNPCRGGPGSVCAGMNFEIPEMGLIALFSYITCELEI